MTIPHRPKTNEELRALIDLLAYIGEDVGRIQPAAARHIDDARRELSIELARRMIHLSAFDGPTALSHRPC